MEEEQNIDEEDEEREHNLLPLPGEELEEKKEEEKENQTQSETQSLNSAIIKKGMERWLLILFTILIIILLGK